MELSERAFRAQFGVDEAEGRIIGGIAVPYNDPTMIFERGRLFEERMAPSVFKTSVAKRGDRVGFMEQHDRQRFPLGRPVAFHDRADHMWMDALVSETRAGNDVLALARDGVSLGLSVSFSVPDGGDEWSDDGSQRTINRADLYEVSVVTDPAYMNARVQSIRSGGGIEFLTLEEVRAMEQPEPDLEEARVLEEALSVMRLNLKRLDLVNETHNCLMTGYRASTTR